MNHRPTCVEEFKQQAALFSTEQSNSAGRVYLPDPTDVFIATYPKCGTTWMQQIVHCLRSGGDTQFSEITEVVPWLELSLDLGVDNYTPQVNRPHAFKSHFTWRQIPKGGRYIHITRNPEDVLISFYRFMSGWFFESGSIDIDTFANEVFFQGTNSGNYWDHLKQWWLVRDRKDVLFLTYENMLGDPETLVESVAAFIGVPVDLDLKRITLEKSSAEFMRQHRHQFDDHIVRQNRDGPCGLPEEGESFKISDSNAVKLGLSGQTKAMLDQKWLHLITPETGLKNYQQVIL